MSQPLVSCLMVTAGRPALAERAVHCFTEQTWVNKELIVIDDGPTDYSGMLGRYRDRVCIRYERIPPRDGRLLGGLRNLSLDAAHGDYCTQWDDDEWYHPRRIEAQMASLPGPDGASVLRYTLMHVNLPDFRDHAYRTALRQGTPGTLLHPRSPVRYPNLHKGEDSIYLRTLKGRHATRVAGRELSHLFIRCYHGGNTWMARHFIERLWQTPSDKLEYLRAKYLARNLWSHRAFQLTSDEQDSVRAFRDTSRALGLESF